VKLWSRLALSTYAPIEDEIMRGQYEESRRPVRDQVTCEALSDKAATYDGDLALAISKAVA